MPGVRKLKSRTEAFWRDEYRVSDADADLVTGLILEAGRPQALNTLVAAIIARRLEREKEGVRFQAENGEIYQPMNHYEVGQRLLFTALEFAAGRVLSVRPGNNPKFPPFQVIRVAFDDGAPEREFAAGYTGEHPLNRPADELIGGTDPEVNDSDLARRFDHYVASQLEPLLEAHMEYVKFNGLWFLRGLLPEIHVGYLNLAEAMIYEAAHPLAAREMLGELEIGGSSTEDARLFALNHALAEDKRFDNLGTTENPIWYMRALEPAAVHARPSVLTPAFRATGGEYVGITLLELVDEVGDELDDLQSLTVRERVTYQCQLPFPHLYAGTLPLWAPLVARLPKTMGTHFPLTLVDVANNQRLQVWAVPGEQYLCGLKDWYASVGMCVGGQIALRPTDDPLVLEITITPVRTKQSKFTRSASLVSGTLVLKMLRSTVDVKCDQNMLIEVTDDEAVAQAMVRAEEAQTGLPALVRSAFQELAKLDSRSRVHAKSIYSLVNLYRRSGTVPILAELTRRACFDPVGDGFWAYSPDAEDRVYRTAETMRERPLSTRSDLVKDQIVQYLG
jgi:hypothetical protein